MRTPNTSPLTNKVICIYNLWFFNELLCYMYKHNTPEAIDESGTLWFIEDVTDILSRWKVA